MACPPGLTAGLWLKPNLTDHGFAAKALRRRRKKMRFLLRHARGADIIVVTESNIVLSDQAGLLHWLAKTPWTATLPDGTCTWTCAGDAGFRGVLVLIRKEFLKKWTLNFDVLIEE